MTGSPIFELDKWYMDVVDEDGSALFAYTARVQLGTELVSVASFCHLSAAGEVSELSTLRPGPPPVFDDGRLAWQCQTLDMSGEWIGDSAPIERTLLSDERGAVEWHCHAPRARAQMRVGDVELHGWGYVERLRVTLPLADLPFRWLSWGRHLSSKHALVWIDWHDTDATRWIFLDGVEQPNARVTDYGIYGLNGGRSLRRGEGFGMILRPAVSSVARLVPKLAHLAEGPLSSMREHRWAAPSRLVSRTRPLDDGWSLYEELG